MRKATMRFRSARDAFGGKGSSGSDGSTSTKEVKKKYFFWSKRSTKEKQDKGKDSDVAKRDSRGRSRSRDRAEIMRSRSRSNGRSELKKQRPRSRSRSRNRASRSKSKERSEIESSPSKNLDKLDNKLGRIDRQVKTLGSNVGSTSESQSLQTQHSPLRTSTSQAEITACASRTSARSARSLPVLLPSPPSFKRQPLLSDLEDIDEEREPGDRRSLGSNPSREPPTQSDSHTADVLSVRSQIDHDENIEVVDMTARDGQRFARILSNNKVVKKQDMHVAVTTKKIKRGGSLLVIPKITIFRKKEPQGSARPASLSKSSSKREKGDSIVKKPIAKKNPKENLVASNPTTRVGAKGGQVKKSKPAPKLNDAQCSGVKSVAKQTRTAGQKTQSQAEIRSTRSQGLNREEAEGESTRDKKSLNTCIVDGSDPVIKIPPVNDSLPKANSSPASLDNCNSTICNVRSEPACLGMTQHDEIEPPENPLNAYGVSAATCVAVDPPVQSPASSDKTSKSRQDRKERMQNELEELFSGTVGTKSAKKAEKSNRPQQVEKGYFERELERIISVDAGDKNPSPPVVLVKSSNSKVLAASKSSEEGKKVEIEKPQQDGFLASLVRWATLSTTKSEPITKKTEEKDAEKETGQLKSAPVIDTTFHRDPELDDDELSRAISESIKSKGMDEELVPIIRELTEMKLSEAAVIEAPNSERIINKQPQQPGLLQLMSACSCIPTQTKSPVVRKFPRRDIRNQRLGRYNYDVEYSDDDDEDNYSRRSDGSFTRFSDGSVALSSIYSQSVYEDISVDGDRTNGSYSVGGNSFIYSVDDDSTNVFSNLESMVGEDEYTADYSSDGSESYSYCGSDDDSDWEVVSVFELPVVDTGAVNRNKREGRSRRNAKQQRKPKNQKAPRSRHPPRVARLDTLEEEAVSPQNDDTESIDDKETEFEKLMQPLEDARAVKDALAVVKQHARRLGIDEKELLKAVDDADSNDLSVY